MPVAWPLRLGRSMSPGSPRVEPRRRFAAFLDGMFAELPRKNCWTIAGEPGPGGMQHFLNGSVWDTDGVAADLREFVLDHLGEVDRRTHTRIITEIRPPALFAVPARAWRPSPGPAGQVMIFRDAVDIGVPKAIPSCRGCRRECAQLAPRTR